MGRESSPCLVRQTLLLSVVWSIFRNVVLRVCTHETERVLHHADDDADSLLFIMNVIYLILTMFPVRRSLPRSSLAPVSPR